MIRIVSFTKRQYATNGHRQSYSLRDRRCWRIGLRDFFRNAARVLAMNVLCAALTACQSSRDISGSASGRTRLLQGALDCGRNLSDEPIGVAEVVDVNGREIRFVLSRDGAPRMTPPMVCARIIASWDSGGWANYPACVVDRQWRVFGSGSGPVTWAEPPPSLSCEVRSGPVRVSQGLPRDVPL